MNKKEVRTCQPKTIFIGQQKLAGQAFTGGLVKLEKRIYDVVAFRVRFFLITLDVNDLTPYGALTLLLTSKELGRLSDSAFYVGTAVSTESVQNTEVVSNVIGWFGRGLQTGTGGNAIIGTSQAPSSVVNNYVRFKSPQVIENFDWNIFDLYGNALPAFTHDYKVEMVLEFHQQCNCGVDFIHQYS